MRNSEKIAFLLLILIYIIGFGIDIMDVDAAQYASMSREMLQTGSYLQLYDVGKDYLDKPPFLIWVSALSMKIFGINNFAYRLPSFLFSLLALFSTYRFASLFYIKRIAIMATIVLATCQAFFLMNHDVRTDTILMSWVIFSIWQLAAFFTTKRFFYFFFACVGIAGGMMTKGPVALIVPLFAFGSHFLLQRNFKVFFKWQYLAGIFIIGILLFPMCIGLYQQFDMQPAKMVNGKTNVSGLRFFFWTQSFGRITGESDWKNNSTIFFGLQNMLWSFLPWIIIFLAGLLINMKDIVRQRFLLLQGQEAITTGGFILTYLSLGLSKYQLPHYIFVVFPLAAIITAKFLHALMYQKANATFHRYFLISHSIIFFLLWLGLIALMAIPFAGIAAWVTVSATLFFITWLFCMFYYKKQKRWLFTSAVATIIAINLFLNSSFYPALLQYQMGNKAGRWLHLKEIPPQNIFIYQYPEMRSLHFYAKANIYHQDVVDSIQPGNWIITLPERLTDITRAGLSYQVFFKGEEFHISRLSLKFLNPSTRPLQLSKYVIVKIGPSN